MREIATVCALALSLAGTVSAQDVAQIFRMPGSIASLAQEIGMKLYSAKVCRIEHLLPKADIATIVAEMRKIDSAAVDAAFLKADIIVRSIELVPGTATCGFIVDNLNEAKPLYATIAGAIRK